MAEDKEKKQNEEPEIGLVTLTGEVGIGMKIPDGNIIELNSDGVGNAQVLAYLVQTVSEIKRNIS